MKITPAKVNDFIKNINNYKAVLIFGPDSSVVDMKYRDMMSELKNKKFNLITISAEQLKTNEGILLEEFYSRSMFGDNSVIVIKLLDRPNDATKYIKTVLDDNKAIESDNFLIVIAEDLATSSSLRKYFELSDICGAIACYEESERNILTFISNKLKEKGFLFDNAVVEYLYKNIGSNYLIIENEINKIALYKDNEKNLSFEDVEKCVIDSSEIGIDTFINSFCSFKKEETFRSLKKSAEEGIQNIILIRSLIKYFLQLQKIRYRNEILNEDLAQVIQSEHIFWKQQIFIKEHIAKWSLKNINLILEKLIELEKNAKFSQNNLFIEDFVIRSFLIFK